jgi:hypothetical protein
MPDADAARASRVVRGHVPLNASTARLILAALSIVATATLLHYSRDLTFFYDEWNFILSRRGESVGTYLDPHNGHLSLFPVVVYKLLFALVGLRHYTPYLVIEIALHLLSCYLLYVLASRRVGPWLALVPATLLLFMGSAYQDLLWPFQIGYLGSIAGGLAALLLVEHRTARSDRFACACLVWSIASSGIGIPFLLASAVALVFDRRDWRSLWIVGIPAVLFAIWYVGWGGGEQASVSAIAAAPQYVANAAAGAAAGIAGLDTSWGPALLALLAVIVGLAWQRREDRAPTPLLLAAGAGCLSFWILSAVVRSDNADPAASRYLYVGAVFLFLIMAEARVGTKLSVPWLIACAVLVLGALLSNLGQLRDASGGFTLDDTTVRAGLTAVEIAAPVEFPAFIPEPAYAPQITAGPYLAAVHALGSPAYSVAELAQAPEALREQGDEVLVRAEQIALVPGRPATAPSERVQILGATGGTAAPAGRCARFAPSAAGAQAQFAAFPGQTLAFKAAAGAPGVIALRRFGAIFDVSLGNLGAGSSLLRLPADRAPTVRWALRLTTQSPTTVCVS